MGSEQGTFHSHHVPGMKGKATNRQLTKQTASSLGGACARCGGTTFEAVRSTKRKLAFGLASLALPKNEVRCVMCGQRYKRG